MTPLIEIFDGKRAYFRATRNLIFVKLKSAQNQKYDRNDSSFQRGVPENKH